MKPVILFVDASCPKPYDPSTFATEGMGGTEATVIRVAEGLAATGLFEVVVAHHNRFTDEYGKARYTYLAENDELSPDYVISLRLPSLLASMQKRFPNAKHYLWNHDLCSPEFAKQLVELSGFEAIAVSQFHKTQMQEQLKPMGYSIDRHFPIRVAYNPIPDELLPDSTPYDKNKLLWTSSPHKGLDLALQIFSNLLSFNPDFKLYIANPGYIPSSDVSKERGVVALGTLTHAEVIQHLRSSLCLWYPNTVFPETFGLVFAEANAVGTPVLAHAMGAAGEVLSHPYETMDCRNPKTVIDRVMSWYSGDRPHVKAQKKFRLSEVLKTWTKLFRD